MTWGAKKLGSVEISCKYCTPLFNSCVWPNVRCRISEGAVMVLPLCVPCTFILCRGGGGSTLPTAATLACLATEFTASMIRLRREPLSKSFWVSLDNSWPPDKSLLRPCMLPPHFCISESTSNYACYVLWGMLSSLGATGSVWSFSSIPVTLGSFLCIAHLLLCFFRAFYTLSIRRVFSTIGKIP